MKVMKIRSSLVGVECCVRCNYAGVGSKVMTVWTREFEEDMFDLNDRVDILFFT